MCAASLDDDSLRRITDTQVIDPTLDRVDDLFAKPSSDLFEDRPRFLRTGIEELGATLASLRRLPDNLTVRIALSVDEVAVHPAAAIEEALHRRAELFAAESRRDALTIRNMGRRQTPLGIVLGLVGAHGVWVGVPRLSGRRRPGSVRSPCDCRDRHRARLDRWLGHDRGRNLRLAPRCGEGARLRAPGSGSR